MWDVIVIGAGIEGSATGYSLVKRGCRVLMLEQFALPHARGSSHGLSRITRMAYAEKFYTRMMVDAFKLWEKLEKAVSTQLYINTGLLTIGDAASDELRNVEESLRSVGAKFERLHGKEFRERFPTMKFNDTFAAVLDYTGGILRANKCLAAFQSEFRKYGGVIQDAETVLAVSPVNEGSVVVKTTKASYEAHSVVIAAGPWTSRLTEPLGLQLPLQPQRVEVWYWKRTNDDKTYGSIEQGSPTFISGYVNGHDEVYGLPSLEYPGMIKVAFHGGSSCDPDTRDSDLKEDRGFKLAKQFVIDHLPGIQATPSVTETCIYTVTPDSNLILDSHPKWKNVVIAAGFSGHGFKLSPIVGEILADLATIGQHNVHDMTPFKLSRFGSTSTASSKL